MRKQTTILVFVMAMLGMSFLQSCNDDDDDPQSDPEFIADDDSFAGFMSWPLEATEQGPDPLLGAAHGGNDSTVVRKIWFQDGQDPSNGTYPIGTLIVKESLNPDSTVNMITAMAKRGNDFNPTNGDWEWFVLMADGSIAEDGDGNKMRGADLMNGMCNACHVAATTDNVFTK